MMGTPATTAGKSWFPSTRRWIALLRRWQIEAPGESGDLLPDQDELDTLMADDLLPCTAENKDTWRNWHKSFGRKVRVASGLRDWIGTRDLWHATNP